MRTRHAVLIAAVLFSPLSVQCAPRPASARAASRAVVGKSAYPLPRAKPDDVGMSSQRLSRIATVLNADIAAGRLPGAVVAIARKGKLVYFEAFGYRDKAANAPMTTDSIFSIASMTKPLAAVGALTLYEQGKLLVDDPLAKYFPQFAHMRVAVMNPSGDTILDTIPASRLITIQDLMRHTSGFVYGNLGTTAVHKLYAEIPGGRTMTGDEFLDRLSKTPLLFQPGTVWHYGFGMDVVGLIVESVAKQRLGEYLQTSVFQPLGMVDTSFVVPPDKMARYAQNLPTDPETGRPQPPGPDPTKPSKFDCAGGCAYSTASDYLRFAQMLLDKGKYGDVRILGRKTVEYMLSNQLGPDVKNQIGNADPTRADYGFGLGLAVRTTPGIARTMGSVGDFSWPGASGTNWWADPKEDLAVVFMALTPGPARWHYRELINALVEQSIVD